MVRDLGEDHRRGDDEEGQRPGGGQAQGRFEEGPEGGDPVTAEDLERRDRQHGHGQDRRGIAPSQADRAADLNAMHGKAEEGDEQQIRQPNAARQHDGRQHAAMIARRPDLGGGNGRRGRAILGRISRFGLAGLPRRLQKVANVEGAHRLLSFKLSADAMEEDARPTSRNV